MRQIEANQFAEYFATHTQWIDVRAPIEFKAGAIPEAINLPLLDDEERHLIGIAYKQQGRDVAIDLGQRMVSGELHEARLQAWLRAAENPAAVIYCFRGGLRSQTVQTWLRERGVDVPVVNGGYKRLRRHLMEALVARAGLLEFQVVSGLTGSGKTAFLHASGKPFIDLEDLAAHRGSAFGAVERSQPTQIDFENALALALLRAPTDQGPILIENESRRIGKCVVPESLFSKILSSPRLQLEVGFETRVENIFKDYVLDSVLGRQGDAARFAEFQSSLRAISRKLGGLRTQEIMQDLAHSEWEFRSGGGLESNRVWIRKLLEWYYDPLYRKIGLPS